MTALPKPVRERDQAYMNWIKTQWCFFRDGPMKGMLCLGPIDPHHVVPKGGGKVGSKVSDRRCVPLCRFHHDLAGQDPVLFRTTFDIERYIEQLNAKYDATHKPKPKPPRSITPQLRSLTVRCDCGLEHKVTKAKVQIRLSGVEFWCIRQMKWKHASWSMG